MKQQLETAKTLAHWKLYVKLLLMWVVVKAVNQIAQKFLVWLVNRASGVWASLTSINKFLALSGLMIEEISEENRFTDSFFSWLRADLIAEIIYSRRVDRLIWKQMDGQIKIIRMKLQAQEMNFPKQRYLRIVLLLRCVNLCPCHETILPLAVAHPVNMLKYRWHWYHILTFW